MFDAVCKGYTDFKPCPYLKKECDITVPFRMDLDGDEAYCIGMTYSAEDFSKQSCMRDRKEIEKVTIKQITEAYNATTDKKKWEFTLEEVIEKYREHGLLKE